MAAVLHRQDEEEAEGAIGPDIQLAEAEAVVGGLPRSRQPG